MVDIGSQYTVLDGSKTWIVTSIEEYDGFILATNGDFVAIIGLDLPVPTHNGVRALCPHVVYGRGHVDGKPVAVLSAWSSDPVFGTRAYPNPLDAGRALIQYVMEQANRL